ncbi:hypothetical protein AX15_006835 [Amanita polypyramis BW_CC]|nr:hypothetical protein AX15_006835 [Amanita polypyramis BW_CC]
MPKLRLKRTPKEEAAHRLRKERRKERHRKRRNAGVGPSNGKYRCADEESSREWASSDGDDSPNPGPSSRPYRHKPDYDTIRVEVEERRFREKIFDAMEDDGRLDSVETQFNDYAHVPGRWRRGMGVYAYEERDGITDCTCLDPRYMDDEEYAEWIRMGMYRLKHAKEYAEQEHQEAVRGARIAQEKAKKAHTKRLEQEAEEEHKRKRHERERRDWQFARQQYDQRWKALLFDHAANSHDGLQFNDIPWPILYAYKSGSKTPPAPNRLINVEHLTENAISKFLLPVQDSALGSLQPEPGDDAKEKRDKLRETMLRFHPDKFEGRIMKMVAADAQASVREGIAQVVRVVNELLSRV